MGPSAGRRTGDEELVDRVAHSEGREHEDEAGRRPAGHGGHGPGSEFEGVLGALVGLTMAFGRGRSARFVADTAGVGFGDRVVDVGCGPGGSCARRPSGGPRRSGSTRRSRCGAWPRGAPRRS